MQSSRNLSTDLISNIYLSVRPNRFSTEMQATVALRVPLLQTHDAPGVESASEEWGMAKFSVLEFRTNKNPASASPGKWRRQCGCQNWRLSLLASACGAVFIAGLPYSANAQGPDVPLPDVPTLNTPWVWDSQQTDLTFEADLALSFDFSTLGYDEEGDPTTFEMSSLLLPIPYPRGRERE